MLIHRPEELLDLFHSGEQSSGRVVMYRKVNGIIRKMQIPANLMRSLAKKVHDLPDISFSSVRFSGQPLLLNLHDIPCITISIPKQDKHTQVTAVLRMGRAGIPEPTATIDDGRLLHFLWALEKPIPRMQFYRISIIKLSFFNALKELQPIANSLNVSTQVPLTGSRNTQTQTLVGACSACGKVYPSRRLEEAALKLVDGLTPARLQSSAGRLLELQALFNSRWWSISMRPELFEDWLLFFGSVLAPFCTPVQLEMELRALAESMEVAPWQKISNKYQRLIHEIAKTGTQDYILIDGSHYSLADTPWNDWIIGRLHVSPDEIEDLRMFQIGKNHHYSPYFHEIASGWLAVGNDDFISETAFCLRSA